MLLPAEQIPNGYATANQFVIVKGGAANFIAFVTKVFEAKEREEVRTPDTDGHLIHAEIELGQSTLMLADSKEGWPFTPAFIQVYVEDAQEALDRAKALGGEIVTRVTRFYGGFRLARFKDPFGNIWWLYEPDPEAQEELATNLSAKTDWHNKEPSELYSTIVNAMRSLILPA